MGLSKLNPEYCQKLKHQLIQPYFGTIPALNVSLLIMLEKKNGKLKVFHEVYYYDSSARA